MRAQQKNTQTKYPTKKTKKQATRWVSVEVTLTSAVVFSLVSDALLWPSNVYFMNWFNRWCYVVGLLGEWGGTRQCTAGTLWNLNWFTFKTVRDETDLEEKHVLWLISTSETGN